MKEFPFQKPQLDTVRKREWDKIKQKARKEAKIAADAARETRTLPAAESQTPVPADSPRATQDDYLTDETDTPLAPIERSTEPETGSHETIAEVEAATDADQSDRFSPEPSPFTWTPDRGMPRTEEAYHPHSHLNHSAPKNTSISRSIKRAILTFSALFTALFMKPAALHESHGQDHMRHEDVYSPGSISSTPYTDPTSAPSTPKIEKLAKAPIPASINLQPELTSERGTEAAGYVLRDRVMELGGSEQAQRQALSLPGPYLLRGRHLHDVTGISDKDMTAHTIPGTVKNLKLEKLFAKAEVREGLLKRAGTLKLSPKDISIIQQAIEEVHERARSMN